MEQAKSPPMIWSYALFKYPDNSYHVHEIYRTLYGIGWTENPISACGYSPDECAEDLNRMLRDIKINPVFEYPSGKQLTKDQL